MINEQFIRQNLLAEKGMTPAMQEGDPGNYVQLSFLPPLLQIQAAGDILSSITGEL